MAIHNNCVFKKYKTVNKTLSLKSINTTYLITNTNIFYYSLVKADQQPNKMVKWYSEQYTV